MEMDNDADETLRMLAAGDTMDYSTWPLLLASVVSRIEKSALNDFPIPRIPQQTAAAPPPPSPEPRFLAPLPSSSDIADPAPSSSDPEAAPTVDASTEDTDKENAAPPDAAGPAPPATSTTEPEVAPGALPPQIIDMLAEITGVLTETFHAYPPHTIQRLAELVLEPRKHYKSLPAYLHAVDRVVHVTSGSNIYPLPPALPDMTHMQINGVTDSLGAREDSGDRDLPTLASNSNGGALIGSDEALGGALLTPIPWLARRAANGGDGSSESGESSTVGSEAGGPSPAPSVPSVSSSSAQTRQGRQFDMQVRTESTEKINGPNGMGSIETVSVINGGSSLSAAQQQRVISQGELIRQEQRAGVVPVHRSAPLVVTSSSTNEEANDTTMGEGGSEGSSSKDSNSEKSDDDMADDEEAPHARGPDLIGAADMGPQAGSSSTFSISHAGKAEVRGIDVEAAVGRKNESQVPPHSDIPTVANSEGSSDYPAMLTPSSSDVDSTTAATEPVQETVEIVKEEEVAGVKMEENVKKEDADADADMENTEQPKSATMSARSSPVKRELEDDVSEAGSEIKRFKSSTTEAEGAASEAASAEHATTIEAKADAAPESETKDETMKEGEGDALGHIETKAPKTIEPTAAPSSVEVGDKAGEEDTPASEPKAGDTAV